MSTEAERDPGRTRGTRDITPAVGEPGGPASYRRAVEGAEVALHRPRFRDAVWSYIYGRDTGYAREGRAPLDRIRDAARRARTGPLPEVVQGPVMKPAVWTWEVPLYFWFGGIAAGSSFVAFAADLAGDRGSARVARRVALGALLPSPVLLVLDLGRPLRFLNMLRVFKPRSPMSTGAWCLTAFGALATGAVAADELDRPRAARALGAANAVLGGYLGSYTGVLLAATAVPVWARSRMFLGPIFVSTAVATGAAASRLALVAGGVPEGHPTRTALGRVETGAIAAELGLSSLNERRLGRVAEPFESGPSGRLFRAAKWMVRTGLALRLGRERLGPRAHHLASALYLAGGLTFRYAWVRAGRQSARDDEAVARTARARVTRPEAGESGQPAPAGGG